MWASAAAPGGAAAFPVQHTGRAAALSALNRRILLTYSARTSRALAQAMPLRLAIPHIEAVLAFNVGKEIEKDALVIRQAAVLPADGEEDAGEVLRCLLQATRDIDAAFLRRVGKLPVGIVIPYAEIEPVRRRRIDHLYLGARRILAAWPGERGMRQALQAAYTRIELERLISEWLRLYALETQVLSRAVRLPALLVPVRERIAEGLFRIMRDTGARLAHAAAGTVYGADDPHAAVARASAQAARGRPMRWSVPLPPARVARNRLPRPGRATARAAP